MRNLLGTHLGNSGLFVLCRLIQSNCDAHMIRGGIFFVTSALWGSNKVSSLHFKPAAVLPNLREVCCISGDSVHGDSLLFFLFFASTDVVKYKTLVCQ